MYFKFLLVNGCLGIYKFTIIYMQPYAMDNFRILKFKVL